MSTTPPSSSTPVPGASRHATSAVDKQRAQLDRLLKDPAKPAYVPPPPKDKSIRPAREMMKNVQGSSAGAGSGEFHVYKAGRRREYERLKLLEEEVQTEKDIEEFERRRREAEAITEAKTAKNRAKRQKKKGRTKTKADEEGGATPSDAPIKKRRLVSGKELVFKRPGEDSDGDEADDVGPVLPSASGPVEDDLDVAAIEQARVTIHEDD